MKAALYVRGDDEQRRRQQEALEHLAEEESLEVAGVFSDDRAPGAGLDDLCRALLAGEAQVVAALEIDRIAAEPASLRRFVAACEIAGIELIATAGGAVRLSTLREMADGAS